MRTGAMSNRLNRLFTIYIREPLAVIRGSRSGFIGFLILLIYAFMYIFGPWLMPLDLTTYVEDIYQPLSFKHPLGTDNLGRDNLMMVVNGARDVLTVALITAALVVATAISVGSVAGFKGGRTDILLMSVADFVLTVPNFPVLVVIAAVVKATEPFTIAVILSILSWPALSRAIRSQVLSLRERDFVEAARSLDLGTRHIVFFEILPNMMPYIAVSLVLAMTNAIYAQIGLFFLGIVPWTAYNWGVMMNLAYNRGALFYAGAAPYILSPMIAIAFFQVGSVLFLRSVEEIFNPRIRKR